MKYIGITGTNGSGKDTVAAYLVNKGYSYYSLSDIIRDECSKLGLEKTRENLIKIGNELRKQYGADILAKKIIENIKAKKINKAVIVSIRNKQEVLALRRSFGQDFMLIALDAPPKIRYMRIRERKNTNKTDARDNLSFEQFIKADKLESGDKDKNEEYSNKQQLAAVMAMSDYLIINDSTLEALYAAIDKIINF